MVRLNLGCGPVQPEGWVNVDGSMRAKLASRVSWIDKAFVRIGALPPTEFSQRTRVLDLRRPLPFEANTVDAIYAGELWEHFELQDAHQLTKECFRVLRSGGVLRVCVPDGLAFWRRYVQIVDDELQKPRSLRDSGRVTKHVDMYFRDICTRRILLGSMGHVHKWQYDEVQLVTMFENAGFAEVERKAFHDSMIDDVALVERSDFLIVEGVKPH